MNMKNLLRISVLCIFISLIAHDANAQRNAYRMYRSYEGSGKKGKKFFHRYYLGFGICSMGADLVQHYTDDVYTKDIKMKISSSNSYCYTTGVYVPFSRLGKESSVGLDIAYMVDFYKYNVGTIKYTPESSITENGFVVENMLPLSVTFRNGGEAILNRRKPFLFAFGAGIAPGYTISKIVSPGLSVSARKFVMMEMGYFAGIAFKLRTTMYFGSLNLVNANDNSLDLVSSGSLVGSSSIDTKVTGKTGLTVTLSLMPFSWGWAKKNDFEDY